jgi:hypothetical protein
VGVREGVGGARERAGGKGGEMAQTLYAHMNKNLKKSPPAVTARSY